jgi:hypothetical protein
MKRSEIEEAVRQVLEEMSVSGDAGGYLTKYAFSKKGQGKNAATKAAIDQGFKPVKMKKRPYSTKAFTYLKEEDASTIEAPFAFTAERDLHTHNATKISEKLGMEVVSKSKSSAKKAIEKHSDKKNK